MSRAALAQAANNLECWPSSLPRPAIGNDPRVRVLDEAPWPTLLVQEGTEWVTVHSKRDPYRDAARQLDAADAASATVLFVIGLGLGYVLDVLDERGWTGKVVALEPDPAIAGVCLRRRDLRAWIRSGRLTILVAPAYDGLDALTPSLSPNRVDVAAIVNPIVARIHRTETETALDRAARAWFGARANQEAKRQNAGRYLLNTLRNLPSIASGGDAAALAGSFAGVPAVLAAAGPSLDRNLTDIARHRDQVVLIAVDTALRPLLTAGIEPDLVVGVDPTEANARHLAELPPCPHAYFVTEGSLDPEAMSAFDGRSFFFRVTDHDPWPWLRRQGVERGRLRAWGSVLTTAFDLALGMGCDPIAFTGADLAFTGGRPYARGTTYEEEWAREQAWGQSLEESWAMRVNAWPETLEPGVDGAPVRTAPHLRSFRDWIVAEAGKATGRTIVNATPGGILIGAGLPARALSEVMNGRRQLPPAIHEAIRTAYQRSVQGWELGPLAPDPETVAAWAATSNVTQNAVEQALRPERQAGSGEPGIGPTVLPAAARASDLPVDGRASEAESAVHRAKAAIHPGLSDRDALFLDQLSWSVVLEPVVLTDPSQDLLAQLRARCHGLPPAHAVVVIDTLGISPGAQVRRAIDTLLCERPDLSLEYRRFVDHESRVSILRAHPQPDAGVVGAARPGDPPPAPADAAKCDAAHRQVAERLVPILTAHFVPASVVDVGCGAGFWVEAFASAGVTTAFGITPRLNGAATPAVVRAPLEAIPETPQRYDLCLCLEVAQHVDPQKQDTLIATCARLSDTVVFSSRPPGTPDGSPQDRPLRYWAAKFWRHGYVIDDSVRARIEHHWSLALSYCDGLVAFRRMPGLEVGDAERIAALTGVVLDAVSRFSEQWLQKVWWSVVAHDRVAPPTPVPDYPRPRLATWPVPRVRMAAAAGGLRVFRFRSDAARWYLTHPAATLSVLEDGDPLPELQTLEALANASEGWVRWRDEVTVKASKGSDPRTNGRSYALVLPADVAWLENQPMTAVPGRHDSTGIGVASTGHRNARR
jgi:hypothetical protein